MKGDAFTFYVIKVKAERAISKNWKFKILKEIVFVSVSKLVGTP